MSLNNINDYKVYEQRKQRVVQFIEKVSAVTGDLNMDSYQGNLEELASKVRSNSFKIQVVGAFKNGKSTFINSLLGEYVLPAYALPCTAVINEVKYGEEKKATLHFKHPLPETLPSNLPEKVAEHLAAHPDGNIPTMDVPYDELEDYVVIPMDCEDASQMILETPYEKVELFWPLELLKNGIEIIDSPGLNEHATRTKVTMEYLAKADAILFVFNAQALCSEAEMTFLEQNLVNQGFTDAFCIVNRIDCIPPRERARVEQYARTRLTPFTSNKIFFTSAQKALDSKEQMDRALYEESGAKKFEEYLARYLTKQKGKLKLAQPARELKRIVTEDVLYRTIPSLRSMLDSSLEDVTARYAKAKPQLAALHTKKEHVISRMNLGIERSQLEFSRAAQQYWLKLVDKIPTWIEQYEAKLSFKDQFSKKVIEKLVHAITDDVRNKISQDQLTWQSKVFKPLVSEKIEEVFGSVESDMEQLLNAIDKVQVDLSGAKEQRPSDVPVWERLVGMGGGLLLGDVGLATSGGLYGLSKELAITFAFEFGAGFVLALLGLLNPVTLITIVASAIIYNVGMGPSKIVSKVKNKISEVIIRKLTDDADTMSKQIVDSTIEQLGNLVHKVSITLETEINDAEGRVKAIIAEMEQGHAHIEERKALINKRENDVRKIATQLDDFVAELLT